MNKRTIYISLFTFLGILISFLIHATIEIPVINLLVSDFNTYSLGLTWGQWYLIHHAVSVILLLLGITLGYLQGKRWWRIIYIEKRYAKNR
ncbi:MAG: hypothetical protein COU71_02915 [Parcubacteria group bacterium CG10_big_fil_rev_8_21_14_0_10_38_31]|nr:MAG: hypothetical protein COU71_02915 [Parcubacteria group bacterium CG10_big_fil_rev_8_21_14_0_10_38_31]